MKTVKRIKYDYSIYGTGDDGRTVNVLSEDEAKDMLCEHMDLVESLLSASLDFVEAIKKHGYITPT